MKAESRLSLRDIERATHVSNSSLSRYLSGQATPSWNVVVALCRVAGQDPRPLRPLWETADRERRMPGRPFDAEKTAARPTARNDLPRDVPGFTARRAEVDALMRWARAGHAVAIDGMGGVGKTALAVHVAHLLTSDFPDCQLYVDLHGFTPGREPIAPDEALLALLRALGVPGGRVPDELEERSALWRSELARHRAIVVLDNAADADHVRTLLPGAGRNAALITSRLRLVDLDGVEPLSLAPLGPADAAELFTTALGPGTEAAPATVTELMKRYGGLPLAIRVAAARLRHRPTWSVADLLDNPAPSDEAGVGKVIDSSLARLGGAQRRMFRLLGVFPGAVIGPFAAAALADVPVSQARVLLDDLVDANLLEESSAQRYRFHDLIRERSREAAQREASAGERDAAVDRVTDFYLHTLLVGREKLEMWAVPEYSVRHVPADVPDFGTVAHVMAWYDAEVATVPRLVAAAVERGRDDLAVQFALVVGAFLGRRGEMDAWYRIADIGVRAAERRGDLREQAGVRYFRGVASRFAGRLEESEADFQTNLDLAVRLDDSAARLLALWRLISNAEDRGDFARVLDLRRQLDDVPDARSHPRWLAFATMGGAMGGSHFLIDLNRAAKAAQEAQAVLADDVSEDAMLRIIALRVLGYARLAQGDARQALEHFQAQAAVSRDTGHQAYQAAVRGDIAEALSHLDRHAEALDEHEAAMTWAVDNGETHREIYIHEAFGRTCLAAGDLDRAAEQFRQAIEMAEPRGYQYVATKARLGLARTLELSNSDPLTKTL